MESPVHFRIQPYEWCSGDRDGAFSIRIYGHTPDCRETTAGDRNNDHPDTNENPSERVLVRVDDYETFCRIELPSVVDGKKVAWNQDALAAYAAWIRKMLGNHEPTRIEYRQLQKTVYYKGGTTYPFFTCFFRTEEAMRHCVNLVNKQGYSVEKLGFIKSRVWETSITSIHKFVTDAGTGYGQWFSFTGTKVPELDKISRNNHEYVVKWKDIKPIPDEESKDLKSGCLEAAVDIEQYSKNHQFFPNKDYVTDVVFQCSFIIQKLNRPETRVKHLLVVGLCADIPGAIVHRFKHEIELIDGLCEMIKTHDPSVILGYNIFKYDFPTLDARMQLYLREWKPCGLIKDQPTSIKTKSWRSSAYGLMTISNLEAEGRICIDMYTIIKRDHKLDRYTLDHVSHHFLGRGKHDITAKQMFEIYAECCEAERSKDTNRIAKAAEEMAKVGAYCLEDSILCIDLFEKLTTWVAITETANAARVTPLATFTQGQQVRVQNFFYQYSYKMGFVIDEREGSKDGFVGGKVQDPIPGRYKNILIFDFASLYPSIIRAFNICFTTLIPPESDIPDSMCHVLAWTEDDKYFRYRFIKQEHFKGILPQMCEDLVMKRSQVRKQINPKNDAFTNNKLNQQQNSLKVTANSIFGALGVTEGRMPLPEGARSITAMGRQLITIAADYVRNKHKGTIVYGDTDSIMVDLGITDPTECVRIGEMLSKEISALYPRPLSLEFERALAIAFFIKKKMYAGIPLCMIRFEKGDIIQQIQVMDPDINLYKVTMQRDGKTVTKHVGIPKFVTVRPPLDGIATVESVDKGEVLYSDGAVGRQTIAGIPLSATGGPDPKELMVKGIILARRDNCIWIREVYKDILMGIMFGRTMQETMDRINEEIIKMMSRQISFQKLLVTRGVGSNYKPNSTYPLKIFVDELKRLGHPVQGGERIDYVFVKCSDEFRNSKQGFKMRLSDMYWQGCETEPLDRIHYVEKIMKNSVEQIFYLGYKKTIDDSEEKHKPPIKRRNRLYTYLKHDYINTWVKTIKEKEKFLDTIRTYRPHFAKQSPAFELSF